MGLRSLLALTATTVAAIACSVKSAPAPLIEPRGSVSPEPPIDPRCLAAAENVLARDAMAECFNSNGDARCYRQLGIMFAASGRKPEAAEAYRRYIQLAPHAPDAIQTCEIFIAYDSQYEP